MRIKQVLTNLFVQKSYILQNIHTRLRSAVRLQILKENNRLSLLEKNIETHSPAYLLKHGYTITTLNGKRITSVKQVKKGDKIRTFVADGDFGSETI